MPSSAVLNFNKTHQRTNTAPGIQTVLCNGATPEIWSSASLLSPRRSVGTVTAADCQILSDSTCSLSAVLPDSTCDCRRLSVLRTVNCLGLTDLRTVNCLGLTDLRTVNCLGLTDLWTLNHLGSTVLQTVY